MAATVSGRGSLAGRSGSTNSTAVAGASTAGSAVSRARKRLARLGLTTGGGDGSASAGAAAATIGGLSDQWDRCARSFHLGAPTPLTISTSGSSCEPAPRRSAKRTATASRSRWSAFDPAASRGGATIGADVDRSGGWGAGVVVGGGWSIATGQACTWWAGSGLVATGSSRVSITGVGAAAMGSSRTSTTGCTSGSSSGAGRARLRPPQPGHAPPAARGRR